MRTSLPPVKLIIHSTAFDLLMAVLEDNALNAPKESDRANAKELMEKRARYTRFYTDESGICASLRMYETEASDMIWQLLLAAVGNVKVRKEYSKDLMGVTPMYREDAKKEVFEEVTVLDKPMLFTCLRIDSATVPKGLYLYEVRHDDDMRGDPVEIAKWIMVNHWGTLISNEPLPLTPSPSWSNSYLEIDPKKDWTYEGRDCTLAEYMEKHPPKKAKHKDYER